MVMTVPGQSEGVGPQENGFPGSFSYAAGTGTMSVKYIIYSFTSLFTLLFTNHIH